ncbi:MAG: prephenate dehydrogenase/arogenate dehydrogenase family protein [Chloroflexi bacterium]|nr:prephenate dehydrogenase/arogenate dehydrogenase family protein [Chloroflexota bacterium]
MRVAILGTGLIGSSIGLRLRREGAKGKIEVVGFDRYADVANAAKKAGAIDTVMHTPQHAVEGAELIILATPLLAIRKMMEEIAPVVRPDAVITDTGSTKTEVMRWADELLPTHEGFVGGHPMAGKTDTGPGAAEATLFDGARWIIVPNTRSSERAINAVLWLAETVGATSMYMDPSEHDAYVAAISHMPMLAATAMFSMERESDAWPELSLLAAGGFRDTTRLAGTDPAMAFDIAVTNREHTIHWLNRYIGALIDLRERVAAPEHEEVLFRQMAEASFEYSAFINGKVGREEPTHTAGSTAAFSFQDFLAGGWMREKMAEVTGGAENRLAEIERQKRMRRDV